MTPLHTPWDKNDIVSRLLNCAETRQIENKPDRISDLLEEAASKIVGLILYIKMMEERERLLTGTLEQCYEFQRKNPSKEYHSILVVKEKS